MPLHQTMSSDPAERVHRAFAQRVTAGDFPAPNSTATLADAGLTRKAALGIFASQCASRQLDLAARRMQAAGEGYYTIGSSGHEGMAAVAAAFRTDDMAFLHYRDGAFLLERARMAGDKDMISDMLLSFACSSEDPVSGGRHKVLGSKRLNIPPQTSTIASHLPKAMGAAYAIGLAKRIKAGGDALARDAVIICSFGDASLNHSTAQGAINAIGWSAVQGVPMPIVLVCEDNGIGISVRTPTGWVEASMRHRPGINYLSCDGTNAADTYRAARAAEQIARKQRKPVFLHLRCARLFGHAGADVQAAYLSAAEIAATEDADPLLHGAHKLIQEAGVTSAEILKLYNGLGDNIKKLIPQVSAAPKLADAASVMASIVPPKRIIAPRNGPSPDERAALFGSDLSALDQPQTLARQINMALTDLMATHDEIALFGEDVGAKGGVYGVTQKLQARFGQSRVFDTLLDEQSILGLAIGVAHNGLLPIPEIQFLAYLHNAEDQLRGEAATLPFFSNGQFANPMVVRIAGLGYQKGFGGHFHNDNSLAVLRDIPGIIVAVPSRGDEAAMMLRECVRLAREEQRVVVFIEPIALYQTRDLLTAKDGGWMTTYPAPDRKIALGDVGFEGQGTDLAIVTYGNGRYLSRQAQADLAAEGVGVRVIDLRWISPLPHEAVLEAVADCKAVLVVDECRRSGNAGEAMLARLAEAGLMRIALHAAEESFIATGPAYAATMPSRASIREAALVLIRRGA